MTISPMIPHVKISDLAASQYLDCAKHTVYSSKALSETEYSSSLKNPKRIQDNLHIEKTARNANFERGLKFESDLFASLQERYPGKVHDHTDTPIDKSAKVLRDAKEGDILYQLGFIMPTKTANSRKSFYEDIKVGDAYRLRKFVPDFLWIKRDADTQSLTIFVIDAKSSEKVTKSYKFQVSSYAYLLNYIINGIRGLSIDRFGGIWLPTNLEEPETFRVDLLMSSMADYYSKDLKIIFEKDPEWVYNEKCKTCTYSEKCASETDAVTGSIPYTNRFNLDDIKKELLDIEDLMHSERPIPTTKINLKQGSKYQAYLNAQQDKVPKLIGTRSLLMTSNASFTVYISIVFNPIHKLPCAYAIQMRKQSSKKVIREFARSISNEDTEETSHLEHYRTLSEHFVEDLTNALDPLKNLRRNADCSIFVYYDSSIARIDQWLCQLVSSGEGVNLTKRQNQIIRKAMRCLLALFHGTNILALPKTAELPADDMEDQTCDVPLLASVEQILKETIALGLPGYYLLSKAAAWMSGTPENDKSVLDEDDIYKIWATGESVEKLLMTQNSALHTIVEKTRAMADEHKTNHSDPIGIFPLERQQFKWPVLQEFNSHTLAQLSFFRRLECLRACDKARTSRLEDFHGITTDTLVLTFEQLVGKMEGAFKVENHDSPAVREQVNRLETTRSLKPYLLVNNNTGGILDAIKFKDIVYKSQGYVSKSITGRTSGDVVDITKKVGPIIFLNGSSATWKEGEEYRLYPRFKDSNTDKVFRVLREEDDDSQGIISDLLQEPNQWADQTDLYAPTSDVKATAMELRKEFEMSSAQQKIAEKLLKKRLQIIWGPPGAGKSHFLSIFINWYINHLYDRERFGKPLVIAVTAFTRNAINNLLETIEVFRAKYSKKLFKIVKLDTAGYSAFSEKSLSRDTQKCKAENYHKIAQHVENDENVPAIVVGGTVWDFDKVKKSAAEDWGGLDMLIIDESSQLLVADAVLAIRCLSKETGRLILAGDHLQLGPIIHNVYPLLSPKDPLLFGSIQQCLMRTKENHIIPLKNLILRKGTRSDYGPNTIQLSDNWRMNEELNAFFQQIYGNEYKERFPYLKLANDQSVLSKYSRHVQEALNPSKSITVIRVHPLQDASEDEMTQLEADIVHDILEAHMRTLIDKPASERPPSSDRDKVDAMVVTPHHRQRVAITNKLGKADY